MAELVLEHEETAGEAEAEPAGAMQAGAEHHVPAEVSLGVRGVSRAQELVAAGGLSPLPHEGVPPRKDDNWWAQLMSTEVASPSAVRDLSIAQPQCVALRLEKGSPLRCGPESTGAPLHLYRMGISYVTVCDNPYSWWAYALQFVVHDEVEGDRGRQYDFQDASGGVHTRRADRADSYCVTFNSDDPTVVSITCTGGPPIRWELAQDADGLRWTSFEPDQQLQLNTAYGSDRNFAVVSMPGDVLATVDFRAQEIRMAQTPSAAGVASAAAASSAGGANSCTNVRRVRHTYDPFLVGTAVEYKSETAGKLARPPRDDGLWVRGLVVSIDKHQGLITVRYTVQRHDGQMQKREKVLLSQDCISSHSSPLRLLQPTKIKQRAEKPPVVQSDTDDGIADPGALRRVLSKIEEERNVPISVDDAFRSLFARLGSTPRVSLDWLRAAGGGVLYENVLSSERLGPLGGGTGDWVALHCVIWPRQEHLEFGRLLISYDRETLCQFGKDSQWRQVRVYLDDGLLTIVRMDDNTTRHVRFKTNEEFIATLTAPKRVPEPGQHLFRVDVPTHLVDTRDSAGDEVYGSALQDQIAGDAIPRQQSTPETLHTSSISVGRSSEDQDRKYIFDVRRAMTAEEWGGELCTASFSTTIDGLAAYRIPPPGSAAAQALTNPVQVIGLRGAVIRAPRANRRPFVAMRLDASLPSPTAVDSWERQKIVVGMRADFASGMNGSARTDMALWAKYLRRAAKDFRQSFEEQRNTAATQLLSAQMQEPALEPEPGPELESEPEPVTLDEVREQELSLQFGGDLNDPAEWTRGEQGGFATVFYADWLGATVAVKVPTSVPTPPKPSFIDSEELEAVMSIPGSTGKAIDVNALQKHLEQKEITLDPIQMYSLIAYCRAVRGHRGQGHQEPVRQSQNWQVLNETRMLMRHAHPHIATCYGLYTGASPLSGEPQQMIVMYSYSTSLTNFLHEQGTGGQTIDLSVRATIATGIASGMSMLHSRRVVHLDLKSPNVLMDGTRPIIADMGTAQTEAALQDSGYTPGTGTWMAPEILKGVLRRPADVYSMGIILWELLTCENLATGWEQGHPLYRDAGAPATPFFSDDGPIWARNGWRPYITEHVQHQCPLWTKLVRHCWTTEPADRPEFEEIRQKCDTLETQVDLHGVDLDGRHAAEMETSVVVLGRGPSEPLSLDEATQQHQQPEPELSHWARQSISPVQEWFIEIGLGEYANAAAENEDYCQFGLDGEDEIAVLETQLCQEEALQQCAIQLGITQEHTEILAGAVRRRRVTRATGD